MQQFDDKSVMSELVKRNTKHLSSALLVPFLLHRFSSQFIFTMVGWDILVSLLFLLSVGCVRMLGTRSVAYANFSRQLIIENCISLGL